MHREREQRGEENDGGDERSLLEAPEELRWRPLRRLGEGIGKVVYASEHWVVKRERSPSAMIALIVIRKILRRLQYEEEQIKRPHKSLGLAGIRDRPDIAQRFDARWRELVNREVVRRQWPDEAN